MGEILQSGMGTETSLEAEKRGRGWGENEPRYHPHSGIDLYPHPRLHPYWGRPQCGMGPRHEWRIPAPLPSLVKIEGYHSSMLSLAYPLARLTLER